MIVHLENLVAILSQVNRLHDAVVKKKRADSDTKDVINGVVFWHTTSDSSPVERVCTFCVVKLIVKNLNPTRLLVTFV